MAPIRRPLLLQPSLWVGPEVLWNADGSRWFTEVLYGGAEEPHCLGVGSNALLAVEQCRYSGLALSRQLFTILGGGDWVVLQPSAQWGQCIGLEHVEKDDRGESSWSLPLSQAGPPCSRACMQFQCGLSGT